MNVWYDNARDGAFEVLPRAPILIDSILPLTTSSALRVLRRCIRGNGRLIVTPRVHKSEFRDLGA